MGEDVLDPRRPEQVGDRRLTVANAPLGLGRVGGVGDPVVPERVDELDVEHAVGAVDDARAFARELGHLGAACAVALQVPRLRKQAVRGEDLEPGILRRDEHDEHLRARRRPFLGRERECGLVAVMAVRDQQLLVVEVSDERRIVEPPELGALDLEVGLAIRPRRRRRPVVEEEDRLELDARRAEQAEAALLRACVGALVRQHRPRLVRLDLQRRDDPEAGAGDAVGADVVLLERPDRGRLLDEDALCAPVVECAGCLLVRVGQREADDVVRAAGTQLLALLVVDDVVGRRHERLERAGHGLVVAQRAEGLDHGHGGQRTNRPAP